MSIEGKRVDLRFGDFACSVRGFEDPVEPLARLLREFGTAMGERAPELGPLFDQATLRRLESEIAELSDGGAASAVPGLVLTVRAPETSAAEGEAGREIAAEPAEAAPAAPVAAAGAVDAPRPGPDRATGEAAVGAADGVTDPDAVDRELRAALTAPAEAGEAPSSGEASDPENLFGPAEEASPDMPDPLEQDTNLFSEPEPLNLFEPVAEEGQVGEGGPNLFLEDADRPGEDAPRSQAPAARALFRGPEPSGRAPLRPVDDPEPRRAVVPSVADLAKKAGASTAQDLIAASAAWLVVVQGQHSFTRREVLEVFDQIPGDHPNSAEARIKGFGKLIRNGQVKLGSDDRFRLSDAERDRFEMLLD